MATLDGWHMGQRVRVHARGRWYFGTVVMVGRKRLHVRYKTAKGTEYVKSLPRPVPAAVQTLEDVCCASFFCPEPTTHEVDVARTVEEAQPWRVCAIHQVRYLSNPAVYRVRMLTPEELAG